MQFWVKKAEGKPLEQVIWEDASHAPLKQHNQTPTEIEQRILEIRVFLATKSDLGEFGAVAIRDHLLKQTDLSENELPAISTINRILERNGAFDKKKRIRRTPPCPGWYLPEVASRNADIDEIDYVEGLYLEGGQEVCTLNLISLQGGWPASWLGENMRASTVCDCLPSHWREFGLPKYAQFDNGNVFAGPRQHPDSIGSVIRLCLSLFVTPVFSIPIEWGIQSAIESYNRPLA